jgi:NTE family protein
MNTYRIAFFSNLKYSSIIFRFVLVLLIFYPATTHAQTISKRPTVGLALSGGGAHGIAHIGVIKVMEEAGLRPDYITGVSMGSIIGGLYAMGYSSDSLCKILKSLNWKLLLSNKLPENKVIFLEKNHFSNSIVSLTLSLRKVVLPSGLINGQQVENTLSYYVWPAADISDFSKLPIPFLSVAADIVTYKKVILRSGYLPDAIRASFSVPSIFTPLRIDTLLLLDGGLIRNFEVTEAKKMGADIIIGSYVGFNGYKADKLQSVSGILEQIAMFRSLDDFEKEKKLVDVLIKPQTKGLSIFDFTNVDSLIKRGYDAALPYKKYFKKLADSLNNIAPQKPLVNILDKKNYTFQKIEIKGNKYYSKDQILGVLDIYPGEEVDRSMITDKIELLYGKAWFDKVKYRVVPRNDSLILEIDCIEKPQSMLYGAVHYDNALLSGIIFEISMKDQLTPRSIVNLRSYIGQYYKLDLSYLQFIDRNEVFGLSVNLLSDNTLLPVYNIHGERGDVISRNFTTAILLNRRIGLNNMMSLSERFEKKNLIPHYISDVGLENLSYNYITTTYSYQINSLDSKYFPDRGTRFSFSAGTSKLKSAILRTDSSRTVYKYRESYIFDPKRFYTLYGNIDHYYSPSGKITLIFGGDVLYVSATDSISAQNNFYLLGGEARANDRSVSMVGFQPGEIPVRKAAGFRAGLDYELTEDIHLNVLGNIFAVQEVNRSKGFSLLAGVGIGAGYMSIIGPIKIGIMYGEYHKEKYFNRIKGYLSIGYNF